MNRTAIFLCVFTSCLSLVGQDLGSIQNSFANDLESSLKELSDLQTAITEERIPMARQLNALESEVIEKRQTLSRLSRSSDNDLVELNSLKSQSSGYKEEQAYLKGLLSEYSRLFETRIHITESKKFAPVIQGAQGASKNPDLDFVEQIDKQFALLDTSLDRIETLLGGHVFAAEALSPDGVVVQGKVVSVGPFAVFASDSDNTAGLAQLQLGSPEPSVIDLGEEASTSIRALVNEKSGVVPVDPTQGNTLKIAATEDGLFEHMSKGGVVMVPIVGLGVVALLIALFKYLQISSIRLAGAEDLQLILSYLKSNQANKAIEHVGKLKGYVGDMLKVAIEHRHEKKEYLEEIMYEKMLAAKPALESLIPLIALTAATAPLLGLLGTVTGMINTFNMITVFGTGDPRTLSGGISEALITTKFGLVVAVPALICHAFVTRKVKGVLGSMEQSTVALINGMPDSDPGQRFTNRENEKITN